MSYRPYRYWRAVKVYLTGVIAISLNDYPFETYTYCTLELARRRTQQARNLKLLLDQKAVNNNLFPISWLEQAAKIVNNYTSETDGHCNVYAILLSGEGVESPQHSVYIGQTFHSPETRFEQHLTGYRASRQVRNRGICLLPSLYKHLNPMSRNEAIELEKLIAVALKNGGISAFGGH